MEAVRTLGHGTLAAGAFAALASGAGVEVILDVRRYPGSRRNPQFGAAEMARWLAEHELEYRGLPALGGRRRPAEGSPNVGLRNEQFRAYADHMATPEFAVGVADLLELARTRRVAALCSESVWWRCHRRLLADHLVLVEEVAVEHLLHDGRLQPHQVTAEARTGDGLVVYDRAVDLPLPDGAPGEQTSRRGGR